MREKHGMISEPSKKTWTEEV